VTTAQRLQPTPPGGQRIKLQVDERLYLKDPTSSDLGERIVEHGILMLDEIGIEEFTFRKLALRVGTTEASIYRYFRSKYRFLLYLTSWYWSWVEYRLLVATANIPSPEERLRLALRELTRPIEKDESTPRIDEAALYRVVVAESAKAYMHAEAPDEGREGFYRSYQRFCRFVAAMITEINPAYPHPLALVSTVLESGHMQKYFAEHLPFLTDLTPEDAHRQTTSFLTELVFRAIAPPA
jgi:AcrR family transcriptional regulator